LFNDLRRERERSDHRSLVLYKTLLQPNISLLDMFNV